MKKYIFYIIMILIFISPYKNIGQDEINSILFGVISIFSIIGTKQIKGNKNYAICLFIMMFISIASLYITGFTIDSLQGLSLYLAWIIVYFIFVSFKENEQIVLKVLTYALLLNCIFYIVLQGAFFNGGTLEGRIDGNIGYANTYALIMLIGLYFNKLREEDGFKNIIDVIFIVGILSTGSRNTLLYLILFVCIDIIFRKIEENIFSLNLVFNCLMAEFTYLIISKLRLGAILVLPIIFIIYYFSIKDKNMKIINIATLVSIPVGGIILFLSNSNLAARLSSMSFNSNELQLRIGYLEDVIRFVSKNPLGGGLNTYMYNQGSFQTGYYDIRYVHNSFGQALYDMGFLGLIVFTSLFIIGLITILKGKHNKRYMYLCLYLTIYLHSILDFDFSYLAIIASVSMIVAFSGEVNLEVRKREVLYKIPFVLVGVYIFMLSTIYYIGKQELSNGKYNNTVILGKLLDNITIGDNASKELEFEGLKGLSHEQNNMEFLRQGINILEEVQGEYNRKLYIYSKLARGYAELKDVDKSSYYYEKNLEIDKHALYVYKQYCDMLTRMEENTGISYKAKREEIMNRYNEVQNSMSEKARKRFSN